MRVFLGPLEICGFYGGLTRGLRELGVTAHYLDCGANAFGYDTSQGDHWVIRRYRAALRWFGQTRVLGRFNPLRYFVTIYCVALRIALVVWVACRHDVIILKSGLSLFGNGWDFRLYRWFGRKLVFIFHGSEGRPPYLNGGYAKYDAQWLDKRTQWVQGCVAAAEKFADYIVTNPTSAQLHTRPFCIYQVVGNPVDDSKTASLSPEPRPEDEPVRVLHAPSLQDLKGSDKIRAAIESLKSRGIAIDYVEVSGVPNSVVMREIARCDFLVDELYSDMHGANAAVEAAMLGRPAIVGCNDIDELKKLVPDAYGPPTFLIAPEAIEQAIETLAKDRTLRRRLGEDAHRFAVAHATPRAAAERMLQLITGQAPPEWFLSPRDCVYTGGVCADRGTIESLVSRLLEFGGPSALRLDDKPELLQKLICLAGYQNARSA